LCRAMISAVRPSTPSGRADLPSNEGDRSRATKTRQVHALATESRVSLKGASKDLSRQQLRAAYFGV
jgi:hypothetical protein